MFSVEGIKGSIQEWFADASDVTEVARTYAAICTETEKQMEYSMEILTDEVE
ncbi:hypothetical protein [Muricomes intestini]|jgi:hypothetical protein|uniref:hypothetical protein n=1 Tax=Muricomes intestini TaxID=1796634 RepID=UPI002FDC81C1